MPFQQRDIIQICEILAEQEDLRVTTNQCLKGACYAFGGAFLGGLLGGPIGLGVGSAAGGAVAAYQTKGKFKSAVHVIMYDMPEREKARLADAVSKVVRNFDATDVVTVVAMINANSLARNMILDVIKTSLTNGMGLTMA